MTSTPSGATPGKSPEGQPQRRFRPQPWWLTFFVAMAINWAVMRALAPEPSYVNIPYTLFKAQVQAGNVEEVTSQGDAIQGAFKKEVTYPPEGPTAHSAVRFKTLLPAFANPGLETLLEEKGVVINARPLDEGRPIWQSVLFGFGPTLLLIVGFVWMNQRMMAGGRGLFGLGRSRAKRYSETEPKVTFDDVAGIDDAENELVEIVDFLKNPAKYQRLGGTVPKGVLLIGAPGTGKTLLARAVAGQAGVPFFSLSAAEFIEMIVGVGAARVRDLFKQAREAAPSIIFVDELDAIGRARGSGAAIGGHDEREQTLNQILTEMDGFDSREGVIVLAATNRADVLDPALLRPGRFDRRVIVQRPDRAGRAAILKVHTKRVPLAADVDLERLAAETPGLVGAELRNLVNEAALLAARKEQSEVHARDFSEAVQKITLGPARHILLNPADRERTAYHESGHALLGLLVPGSDPVHRVTIVPRGMALGATYQLPIDDRTNYPEDYLRARIISALGGRAAEQLIYGVVTSGGENDLRQVTEIARQMVLRWGMSEKLGPISFVAPHDDGLPPAFQRQPYSEATAELIDAEVQRIVEECQSEASRLLAEHRDKLVALAVALLKAESLDEREILEVTGLAPLPARAAGGVSSLMVEHTREQTRSTQVHDVRVPTFIYGTAWKEDATARLVRMALDAGFRGIDTANQRRHYHEAGVGEALAGAFAAGRLRREDVFLQTKFTYVDGQDHRLPYDPCASLATQVEQSFASSLQHLGVDYLDSYVLHGPSVRRGLSTDDWETWEAMERSHGAGKTRLLGVSNVNVGQLAELYAGASTKPAIVQNRCFASMGWDRAVRQFCSERGILYQGFSLLTANREVLGHRRVHEIAARIGRTVPQVIFRFALQLGMIALTGTTSAMHMTEDLSVYDFELEPDEVRALDELVA